MKILLTLTAISFVLLSFNSKAQTDIDSKLRDSQKRLPMSRIEVDQLDRYYDNQFLARRVQRLERINMQMQGRLIFLENLVADIGGGFSQVNQFDRNLWTCTAHSSYLGTHMTKIGARALAIQSCVDDHLKRNIRNYNCNRNIYCEQPR